MAYDPAFGDWVRDHLHGLGPIEIRPMFGGAGVKFDGAMFAILDDGVLWLKADEALARDLQAEGARQFTYPTKDGRQMAMAYWSLPETALDARTRRSAGPAGRSPSPRRRLRPALSGARRARPPSARRAAPHQAPEPALQG